MNSMKAKGSVFFKDFVITVCVFTMCFVAFGMATLAAGRMVLIREQRERLYASAEEVQLLAEAVSTQAELNGLELRMSLAAISQCAGIHIFLCDTNGVVLTSSDAVRVSPYIGLQLSPAVLAGAAASEPYETFGTLDGFYETKHFVVSRPIGGETGTAVAGYVFVSSEASGVLSAWGEFIWLYLVLAAVILALAATMQYLRYRRMSRPLREMAEAADRFARGDYSARVSPYDKPDEIGLLTEAFNSMAESLSRNETRRSEFIANVSHELRTPITTISGFADGLLDGTIPPSQERHYLETISAETKRLSRLVRSMLDMSRLRDGAAVRMERFDLSEMVVQTVLNFEERVEAKHLSMELNMPEARIFVRGDEDALTRVVYNLVDNAIKFADEDTALVISVWKENGRAFTCVQDTGAVIPPEELPLIFDRFHKSDKSRSQDRDGVGLGLYMVREIIAAHEQDIFVTSENGVTAFTFTLALADNT